MNKKHIFKMLLALFLIGIMITYNIERSNLQPKLTLAEEIIGGITSKSEEEYANADSSDIDERVTMVMPSGKPIGIYVKSQGVMVIGIGNVIDIYGNSVSPCSGKLMPGDYIYAVDSVIVSDKTELIDEIKKIVDDSITLSVKRDKTEIECEVTPVKCGNGYMLGLWVKDDISGIGTMTFIDENGFAALGHSINDNDTGEIFEISDGAIYGVDIVNIVKSDNNSPGRLEGMIEYSATNTLGRIYQNNSSGINGVLTKSAYDEYTTGEWIPTAKASEVEIGSAYILSYVSGEPEYYEVIIVNIDLSDSSEGKNFEIVVRDSRLLALTGGIVQGMSGTPIIQNGRLVGAVTHVFLSDSTKGYGTFVETMMCK